MPVWKKQTQINRKMTRSLCPHCTGVWFQACSQRVLEGDQAEYNEKRLTCTFSCVSYFMLTVIFDSMVACSWSLFWSWGCRFWTTVLKGTRQAAQVTFYISMVSTTRQAPNPFLSKRETIYEWLLCCIWCIMDQLFIVKFCTDQKCKY